jgi:hypothetical protein
MTRSRWAGAAAVASVMGAAIAVVSVMGAASAGCGQQAPDDLSYVLVELDTVGKANDAVVTVIPPTAASSTLCVKLESVESATQASLVLYRAHGADPTPDVKLIVTSYAQEINGDDGVSPGLSFTCPPASQLPMVSLTTQLVSFGFCANESVKVQVQTGSTCGDAGCDAGQVCGAGIDTDGQACPAGKCCSNMIPDACALPQAPTTGTTAP